MNTKLFLTIILFSRICLPITAETNTFTVAGIVFFEEEGNIHVSLEIKEGKYKKIIIRLSDADLARGSVDFKFIGIPKDTYSIRCFQDENGNGKFDLGAFGPKEPWGNYIYARPPFRGPEFNEMAFYLYKDITDIEILLE